MFLLLELRRDNLKKYPWTKEFRIRKRSDYLRIQGKNSAWRSSDLILLYQRNRKESFSRVGLTVSRKVGNAVLRNRVKRWLREALRHEYQNLKGSWDIVIIAKSHASESEYSNIHQQIVRAFHYLSRRCR